MLSLIQSFNKWLTFTAQILCAGNRAEQSPYICSSPPRGCTRNEDAPGSRLKVTTGK